MTRDNWTAATQAFESLCKTIAALRDPVNGCPWDLEQTHETLRRYMIEEAYEAADVMHPLQVDKFKSELGDVLLQVVLNAQIASDNSHFKIEDVVRGLDEKMRRRHPHVFSKDPANVAGTKEQVREQWDQIKREENKREGQIPSAVFAEVKPGAVTPALATAVAIGKIAKKIQFDWKNPEDVFNQFRSEVDELKSELFASDGPKKQRIYDEMGDVFFSLAQLCRHLEIDPEICALDGNRKFLNRFSALEALAAQKGINPAIAGTTVLEELWGQAKKLETQA